MTCMPVGGVLGVILTAQFVFLTSFAQWPFFFPQVCTITSTEPWISKHLFKCSDHSQDVGHHGHKIPQAQAVPSGNLLMSRNKWAQVLSFFFSVKWVTPNWMSISNLPSPKKITELSDLHGLPKLSQ